MLPAFVSPLTAARVAEFLISPPVVAVTLKVKLAESPGCRAGTLQLTWPPRRLHPALAAPNVTSVGIASSIVVLGELDPPTLPTASVYVNVPPAATFAAEAVFDNARSGGPDVEVAVDVAVRDGVSVGALVAVAVAGAVGVALGTVVAVAVALAVRVAARLAVGVAVDG